ncbi:hypothetical protein CRE_17399 [Caenorhabditis remanei]|uniref:DUF38 domain-containing protein n=1 Tax=Caenorhabditis remanei TaxID=31234 RepID=E3N262_CAERE|nr:hypothetical protein CRE_17399 [Caenorhabditis remanei]
MVFDLLLSYSLSNLIIPSIPIGECLSLFLSFRAHIIARAPGLQKIDKLIPLSLENLHIKKNELVINKLWITCDKDEVNFKMNRKTFSRRISESQEDKMKKLINFYTCGRSKIHVDRLYWHDRLPPDFLPVDMKFRVNSVEAVNDFETAILFIDPQSFPLITLNTDIYYISIFDDQVVKSAETFYLNLAIDRIVTVEDFKKLNNKTVELERFSYFKIDIIPLIKHYIEAKKEIRTTFRISTCDKDFISEKLREFELAFGEYRSNLDGVNERFLPGSSKYLIPINNESRIQVYAIEEPVAYGPLKIIVKPVSGL